ncbi:MAG: hypothetical protein ACOX6V_02675 [Patescibacteria group bacterium]
MTICLAPAGLLAWGLAALAALVIWPRWLTILAVILAIGGAIALFFVSRPWGWYPSRFWRVVSSISLSVIGAILICVLIGIVPWGQMAGSVEAVTNGLRTNGSTPTPDPVLVAIQGMREDVNEGLNSLDRRITALEANPLAQSTPKPASVGEETETTESVAVAYLLGGRQVDEAKKEVDSGYPATIEYVIAVELDELKKGLNLQFPYALLLDRSPKFETTYSLPSGFELANDGVQYVAVWTGADWRIYKIPGNFFWKLSWIKLEGDNLVLYENDLPGDDPWRGEPAGTTVTVSDYMTLSQARDSFAFAPWWLNVKNVLETEREVNRVELIHLFRK